MSNLSNTTKALHAGHDTQNTANTRAVPIYQTTSYVFDDTDHAANLFGLKELGYIYTRLNNPTNDILEQRLASIEGGIGAAVFASGTSAIATTFLTLFKAGDHIVSSSSLYGGTYNLLNVTLPRLGIETAFVNADLPSNFQAAIRQPQKAH
jgi:O-acetylhomoserine (thiol)-lyase